MTNIAQDIQADLVLLDLKSNSQKHVLQSLCREICTYYIPSMPNILLDRMMEQENIASSGIGEGVAIPHLKMPYLSRPFLAVARLACPIDFNAIDHRPVDLICVLLSPKEDGVLHLQRLSRLTRRMKDREFVAKLRGTNDIDMIRSYFSPQMERMTAAA